MKNSEFTQIDRLAKLLTEHNIDDLTVLEFARRITSWQKEKENMIVSTIREYDRLCSPDVKFEIERNEND